MKHQTERKAYSDEELDRLLRKSMVELPKKIEESLESETDEEKAAFDAYFDENRRALLKERIDLEREKQRFEGEKKVYAKKRRIKIAVAVAAAFAIIIAVPVTSQSARRFLSDLGLHIFSDSNTIMEGDKDGITWRTNDENKAWEKAKECFEAPRMLFEGYGDELGFEEGKYYKMAKEVSLAYYLNGKFIFIKIKKITEEEKLQNLIDGKLMDEYQFEGNETAYVRLYEIENVHKEPVGSAEIVYGENVYLMDTEIEYDKFKNFIKNIYFEAEK